jgi:protocatechuate 3,4-dioxygenase beta subunit
MAMRTRRSDPVQASQLVSRRRALAFIGTSGAMLLAGPLRPAAGQQTRSGSRESCVRRPQQTEGPFFVEEALNRSDIRTDPRSGEVKAGAPLRLAFSVSRLSGAGCTPLAGAQVDVWQADATGRYSDSPGFGSTGSTAGQQYLRGYQLTDAAGDARFLTIFPGWYGGRAVHLHFKIRWAQAPSYTFTSQLYFDDALTERVYAMEPYASRGRRWLRNDDDAIFRDGGKGLLLAATPDGLGYAATFEIGLQI